MKDPRDLSPAEFQIAEILWESREPLSVQQVLEVLQGHKVVAYTTVMTHLDKMARQGSLGRVKRGKAYYYSPCVPREEVLARAVEQFTEAYFGGRSRELLRLLASQDGRGSPRDSRRVAASKEGTAISSRSSRKTGPASPQEGARASPPEMEVCLL